jgi:protease-4
MEQLRKFNFKTISHSTNQQINKSKSIMTNPNDIYSIQEHPNQSGQSNQSNQSDQSNKSNQRDPNVPPIYIQLPPQQTFGCGALLVKFIVGIAIFFVCGLLMLVTLSIIGATMSETIEELSHQESVLTEKFVKGNSKSKNKIAILTISGIIRSEEDGFVAKQIRQISSDANVKAIVLRVDSPGGTISGSDYYLHLMKKMKHERNVPIVVSMGSIAASGGYYVSMVGNEIYAEPSTITGSIGVIVALFNAADLCKKIGVESTPITSGSLKGMGSITKPLDKEERKIWQDLVDENFKQFKDIIRTGRKIFDDDPELLDKLATGQIYSAAEAKQNGLIDEIGYIDDAIKKAIDLSGINEYDVKVIKFKPKVNIVETLLESKTGSIQITNTAETINDLSTPKVYLIMPQVLPIK